MHRRLLQATAAMVAVSALIAGVLSGASQGKSGSGGKIVGHVTSLSGSKKLFFKDKNGNLKKLHDGDALHLGETIKMGHGVKATLTVKVPGGVSPDKQLVFIRPVGKTQHVIKLNRKNHSVHVSLGDS